MSRHADVPRVPEREHAAHMEAVRAVHRRSAYERVRRVMAELEVMGDPQDCLPGLRQMRDALQREMIEHGQIEAA